MMTRDNKSIDNRVRFRKDGGPTALELFETAQALAQQVEDLLAEPACQLADSSAFRVRLARAHTLSLLDELSVLLRTAHSERAPMVRCSPRDGDEAAGSAVRPANWR